MERKYRLESRGQAPITSVSPGAFPRGIDTALLHPDGTLYLFRGRQHMRYNLVAWRPETGYPREYAPDWPGVFPDRIDAALAWAPDLIYFFADGAYTSYSPARRTTRSGYPKPIVGNWPVVGGGPVRLALVLPGDRRVLVSPGGVHIYDTKDHCWSPGATVTASPTPRPGRCLAPRDGRQPNGFSSVPPNHCSMASQT